MNYLTTYRYVLLLVCLLYSITISATASPEKTLLLKPSPSQVDSVLRELDEAIEHKAEYQSKRLAQADSLAEAATQKQGMERIEALKNAYTLYSHISGRKTMQLLDRIASLPEYKADKNLRLWVLDSRAYIYSVMGMYHRSFDLMNDVNVDNYDRAARMHHYDAMYNIMSWMGNVFREEGSLLPEEKVLMKQYNDSLMTYKRSAKDMAFTEVNDYLSKQDYDGALQKLVQLYPEVSGKDETYVFAHLCDVFEGKKDTLALTYYFAKASINDIKDGTTEYMCLPILIQYLFKQGEVERAYQYMKCCIEDAYLYPSEFLISQTTNIFPIIDKEIQQRKHDVEESKHNMFLLLFFAVLMFVVLIGLSIFLHHRHQMMQELKEANDQLAATNIDLERANNVKNVFLQNMTHELHTPMNAINGFAQLLDSTEGQIDSASLKEMTSAIRLSSHQLNMLIDNIIMLTKYENNNVETKMSRIDMRNLFTMLKQEVYNNKPDKVDIIYENRIPDDYPVISSHIHILTILLNLIDNSLKFTDKGHIKVIADVADGKNVVFTVSDTGFGIPTDKQQTVFERFSKNNEFAQGAGLGLPLCNTITKIIGGKIRIDKSDSNGTTISVIL